MIDLDGDPQKVPQLERADGVDAGKIYVLAKAKEGLVSQLEDGERVVLQTKGGGRRDLETVATANGPIEEGTYLNEADFLALGSQVQEPALRRYRRVADPWKKAASKKGALLLATTGLSLLVVAFGLWFTIFAESGTSTATVAERAQSLLHWAAAPVGSAADGVAESREARAQQCLTAMRGGEAEVERVHGVECKTASPSFFHDKESAALVSAILGALTALFGSLGLSAKLGFGKEP
jgi:hypothetical protein